ncbi:MAG: hypothetical protein J7L66_02405 [Anaerolineaceae bacterium]|nr:hypothetical protein [Anaerolineaceae bacterium]
MTTSRSYGLTNTKPALNVVNRAELTRVKIINVRPFLSGFSAAAWTLVKIINPTDLTQKNR